MKNKWLGALLAFSLAFFPATGSAQGLAPGEELGFRVLRQLYLSNGEALLSPASLLSALSMVAEGARGQTLEDLLETLGTQKCAPSTSQAMQSANAVFLTREAEVLDGYLQALSRYGAERFALEDAREEAVNDWAREATEGAIGKLLDGPPDPNLRLALVSAVALKAQWQKPFDPIDTYPDTFHAEAGDVQADFLHDERVIPFGERDGILIARLPYQSEGLAAWFLLPQESGMARALDRLCLEGSDLLTGLSEQKVRLSIPRLSLAADNRLTEMLSGLGLSHATGADADFSGINAKTDLALQQVSQSVVLKLDEEGTRAAAATQAQLFVKSAAPSEEPKVLTLDRPFILLIRDESTDQTLFAACVAQP